MPEAALLEARGSAAASPQDFADLAAFFDARARAVDQDAADVRDGLRWLARRDLLGLGLAAHAPHGHTPVAGFDGAEGTCAACHTTPHDGLSPTPDGLVPFGEVLAAVAERCMASAFALWCHRMVLEYVAAADAPAFPRDRLLARLLDVDLLGSTALGAAMAHLVTGTPLTVRYRRAGAQVVLDGRITWASNLVPDPGAALTVTAAVDDDGHRILVAVPLDTPGVRISPYPTLLALQASRSSSVTLADARVPAELVLTEDFAAFLPRIRPTFLALQSSFCWGLARAALAGARTELHGTDDSLADELEGLEQGFVVAEAQLRANLRTPSLRALPMRAFVQTRLDFARLAGAATRLEATLRGGRAYRVDDPAGRRFREAAFLPVQAPTEGQLRWELAHSV